MSRHSDMRPVEAKAIITEVYGVCGQIKMAADIKRGAVTISRWCSGVTPIGTAEATLLRLILVLHRRGCNWRKWLRLYETEAAEIDDVI
jgi:hypothetical protein